MVFQGLSRAFSLPVVSVSPNERYFSFLLLLFSEIPLQKYLLFLVKYAATGLGFSELSLDHSPKEFNSGYCLSVFQLCNLQQQLSQRPVVFPHDPNMVLLTGRLIGSS